MNYILYKTTCIPTGHIYVGKHQQEIAADLFDGYLGSGSVLKKYIKKYGKNSFVRETLACFSTEAECLKEEERVVNLDFINRKDTLNVVVGGQNRNKNLSKNTAGTTWMFNKEISVRINKNNTDTLLSKGYCFGRPITHKDAVSLGMKSQVWMNKNGRTKQVPGNIKDQYLQDGWTLGRGKTPWTHNKGKLVCIYKYNKSELIERKVDINRLNNYLLEGWTRGTPSAAKSTFGKIAITLGDQLKYVNKCDVTKHIKLGWKIGNLLKKGFVPKNKGKKFNKETRTYY